MVDREVPDGGEDVLLEEERAERPREDSRMDDRPGQILAFRCRRSPVVFRKLPRNARRLLWNDQLHGWETFTCTPAPAHDAHKTGKLEMSRRH
jgi:hypothetical protein